MVSSPKAQELEPTIIVAARSGEVERVQNLLAVAEDIDLNATNASGRTALMLAALQKNEAMLTTLLEAGANPNLQDTRGSTALLMTADSGEQVVGLLIQAGADVNIQDKEGRTPLIVAARRDAEAVKMLLAAGADVNHRDAGGVSALTVARGAGNDDVIALLHAAGAEESLEQQLNDAVRRGDREQVARLIEAGVDVNALDTEKYQPPLMTAVEHRQLDILLLLTQAGADPTIEATGIETSGENALTLAAAQGSPWALRNLLETGVTKAQRDRVLFEGCSHAPVLRVALELGASVNVRNVEGATPLMCAAASGATEAVALLLEAGADQSLESPRGETASALARRAGHDDVVALLASSTK